MRDSPTDFTHRSYGAFKGVHLSQVHQHNKIYILPQNSEHILAGIFSHRFQNTQNFLAEKNSVKSVDSVGDIHALTSVRICEICGSFFNCKLRAVSQGPEHEKINLFLLICSPTDFSFWWDILPQISQIYTELSYWEKFWNLWKFFQLQT